MTCIATLLLTIWKRKYVVYIGICATIVLATALHLLMRCE